MKKRINEELSISKDVEIAAKDVCGKILATFNEQDPKWFARDVVRLKSGERDVIHSSMFNIESQFKERPIHYIINVFIFTCDDSLNQLWRDYSLGGSYDQHSDYIHLRLPAIYEKGILKGFMHDTVYHELEHLLQYSVINNPSISKRYKTANIISNEKIPKWFSEDDKLMLRDNPALTTLMAYLIYYYHPHELDASLCGLYSELVENGCNITETNYWANKVRYDEIYQNVVSVESATPNKDNVIRVCRIFDFQNFNQFLRYIEKQRQYLNTKIRKVVQRAKNEINLNESLIFHKGDSFIPYFFRKLS